MRVFSTCPHSKDAEPSRYLETVADVARWSEAAGCAGILVYTDNSLVDPWLVSQVILQSTERLAPLVAIQPVYIHPYAASKMVASLGFLHRRPVALNLVAGGFKNDLEALGDETPHDERYARTTEYTQIMMGLLRDEGPLTFQGRYYHVRNLRLTPPLPRELLPELLMSGSSPAGLAAARALGATPVRYPQPPGEEQFDGDGDDYGVRVGIVARPRVEDAWRVARERFPEDRAGRVTHTLAMTVSDSHWHRQLSTRQHREAPGGDDNGEPDPYWLGPFQNYKTFCPYLVGSYERVAREIAGYVALGASTFILDIPASEEELEHVGIVFERCQPAGAPA
jgi:alkanesulfonate monooxygenase